MRSLVTVIVPMYNEEKKVALCVDVLKKQTNQNFDVIFINDGSTDNTVKILKECLGLDTYFNYKIITQENQGAAAARENGIQQADTDFVMIFDCDDKISNNYIDEILNICEKNEVDIILPNAKIERNINDWVDFSFYTEDRVLNPTDCILNTLNGWRVHGWFTCRKNTFLKSYNEYYIYNVNKKNFINNDEILTRLNFKNAKKIIRTDAEYYYCYNELSTTKKINERKYLMVNNALILNKIFSDNSDINFRKETLQELIAVLWGTFIYMHKYRKDLANLSDWQKILRISLSDLHYFSVFTGLDVKKKVQLTVLKLAYIF